MSTWYKAGTASFANGSATVTGSGTSWVDNVKIGDALRAPDGRAYEIVELVSSSELEIRPAYEGSSESNADYAIQPTRGILQRVFNQIQEWLDAADNYLLSDNNLSDLDSAPTSRDNLGLGSAATEDDSRYVNVTDTQTIAGVKTFSGGVEAASYGGDGVTQSSTDTTAGRIPTVGWMGLGATSATSTLNDFSDMSDVPTRFFRTENLDEATNPPPGASFRRANGVVIQGFSGGDEGIVLLANGRDGRDQFWFGRWEGEASPVTWQETYHTANLVGTVSQSGGDPTGAVIERGSNSNGEYTRFADGTQVCSSFAVGGDEITFPVLFAADPTPRVAVAPRGSNPRIAVVRSSTVDDGTGFRLITYDLAGETSSTNCHWIAFGRSP